MSSSEVGKCLFADDFKTEYVLPGSQVIEETSLETRMWRINQEAERKKCRVKLNRRLRKDAEKSRIPKSASKKMNPLGKNRTSNYLALPKENILRTLSNVWRTNGLFLRNREPEHGITKFVSMQQSIALDRDKEHTSVQAINEIWRVQYRKGRSNNQSGTLMRKNFSSEDVTEILKCVSWETLSLKIIVI